MCIAEGERVRIQELSRQQVSPLALVTSGASAAATGPASALGLLQVRCCRGCLRWKLGMSCRGASTGIMSAAAPASFLACFH
jgi:hypothetical protein